jgi:hypothetical protein
MAGGQRQPLILLTYRPCMAQPISSGQEFTAIRPARRTATIASVAGAALGVTLLLAAVVLWFRFGTAVFFETIASGIASCF